MSIDELTDRIRRAINTIEVQEDLLQDEPAWNAICSALDLIGDTGEAIYSYEQIESCDDKGLCYLYIYGVLQTLLLQQDAAKEISELLNLGSKIPKQLQRIRIIRNSAAGHPAKQREKGKHKASFITRISLTWKQFELSTHHADDQSSEVKFETIDVKALLLIQREYLGEVLIRSAEELERRVSDKREKYRDQKLVDCLPDQLRYYLNKAYDSTKDQASFPSGTLHVGYVLEAVDKMEEQLTIRNEWDVQQSVKAVVETIRYALGRVEDYFSETGRISIPRNDAEIFIDHVGVKVNELRSLAAEIDDRYESNVL